MTSDVQGFSPNSRQTHIASPKPQAEEKEQLKTGGQKEIALSKKRACSKIKQASLRRTGFVLRKGKI